MGENTDELLQHQEMVKRIEAIPKAELPIVWADVFTGVRSNASQYIPEDISQNEETEILQWIASQVGMKACWRECLKRIGWTDQLFDDWWESTSEKKTEQQLDKNSPECSKSSGKKNHFPVMQPLAIFLGIFLGELIFLGVRYLLQLL